MTKPLLQPIPQVNLALSPSAPGSRNRADSASLAPQADTGEAPPIPTIGSFALAAIAHIKPPAGVVKS